MEAAQPALEPKKPVLLRQMEPMGLDRNFLPDAATLQAAAEHLHELFEGRPVKKVLLVNPPDIDKTLFDYATAKRGRSNNYPTYGLGVIGRHLLNHGLDIRICNLNHEVLKKVAASPSAGDFDFTSTWTNILYNAIDEFRPDLIGATCIFSVTGPSLVDVCRAIKEFEPSWRRSKIPLAIGGVHVTHDVENIFYKDIPEADFAFMNEAEKAFLTFIDVVNGNRQVGELGQIIVRHRDQFAKFLRPVLPEPKDLDVIPPYEIMDISAHSQHGTIGSWYGFRYKETRIGTVQSNRGCRASCSFCNVRTFHGIGVRQRSVDSVLDELAMLHEVYGIGHIIWLDDDLLHNEKRAVALFNGMVQRNLQMTWDATNGVIVASITPEVLDAAHASGCIGLHLGIESGNADILKQIRKPGTPDAFRRGAELLRKYPDINIRALLIIGFPKETLRMIFDTIQLVEDMVLDWHNIAILQPWKKTPIYDAMVEEGLLGESEGTLKDRSEVMDQVSQEEGLLEKKEPSKATKAPYQLGPYSRQRAIEQGKIEQSHFGEKTGENRGFLGVKDFFTLDRVPTAGELDDIWFYMNFRLNFSRLMREKRPVKLHQQLKWLSYVSNLTAPDNALIMYFLAFLQHSVLGQVEPNLVARLEQRMRESSYWQERFTLLGLSPDHVTNGRFPAYFDGGFIPSHLSAADVKIYQFSTEPITA